MRLRVLRAAVGLRRMSPVSGAKWQPGTRETFGFPDVATAVVTAHTPGLERSALIAPARWIRRPRGVPLCLRWSLRDQLWQPAFGGWRSMALAFSFWQRQVRAARSIIDMWRGMGLAQFEAQPRRE